MHRFGTPQIPSSGWPDLPAVALADGVVYVLLGLLVLASAGCYWRRGSPARPAGE
jgi:hypothetical protein